MLPLSLLLLFRDEIVDRASDDTRNAHTKMTSSPLLPCPHWDQ